MKKKTIALLLVLMLVFGVTCGGTIAYLTSTTGPVTNTFTVGKVAITLDEAKVDVYGEKGFKALKDAEGNYVDESGAKVDNPVYKAVAIAAADRVTANEYKLIPGHTYAKDPTIHVQPGSEKCYVFVKVEDQISAIEDAITIDDQIKAKNWTPLDGVSGVYYKIQDAVANDAEKAVDLVVFENFKIKTDADVSTYTGKNITITGYAVQFDGFDNDIAGAWAAVNK